MGVEVISANLSRLREERGLTQEQVAEKTGISRVAYRNLESGESIPKADTLHALAKALSAQVGELVTPVTGLRAVRFRSLKRLHGREQILAEVSRRLTAYSDLENLLGDTPAPALPQMSPSVGVTPEEQAREAAMAVRDAMGLKPSDVVRDICGLLETHGIKVLLTNRATDAFFGLSVGRVDSGPAVIVNAWERISVERKIFTAAHELGHLVLHLGSFDANEADEERDQEKEANIFGGYFLMPMEVFKKEWDLSYGLPLVDRVLKVKRIFGVSYMTVLQRIKEIEPDGPNYYAIFKGHYLRRTGMSLTKEVEPQGRPISDFRQFAPEPMRAGEPDTLSPNDFREERIFTLVRRAVDREKISLTQAAKILGYTPDEMEELRNGWEV